MVKWAQLLRSGSIGLLGMTVWAGGLQAQNSAALVGLPLGVRQPAFNETLPMLLPRSARSEWESSNFIGPPAPEVAAVWFPPHAQQLASADPATASAVSEPAAAAPVAGEAAAVENPAPDNAPAPADAAPTAPPPATTAATPPPAADAATPPPEANEAIAPAAATAAEPPPAASEPAATPTVALIWGPPTLDPLADPTSPRFIGPPLVPPIRVLGKEVAPGSKQLLRWRAGQGFAGGDTVAPVHVVHGSRPGPTLCLAAAIHGDEINGVEVVRRLVNSAQPDRLSGTLIAVPIVNLFGFARGSRYLPDRRDLNRFFPGSQRGSIASRVAFSFFSQVIQHCDGLVDFHTGSFDRSNLPQVRADLRMADVLRFVRGFGSLPVLHSDGTRGMLRVAASAAGIPAVTFEVGAPGLLEVREIETAKGAIEALMHSLGMTPDEPMKQEPQAVFYDSLWVRADSGGLLMANVALGTRVQKGERLGVVVDPLRNVERDVLSPVLGRVIGMARNQVVLPGFAVFHIGKETSAEQASDAAATGSIEAAVEEDPDPPATELEY